MNERKVLFFIFIVLDLRSTINAESLQLDLVFHRFNCFKNNCANKLNSTSDEYILKPLYTFLGHKSDAK